MRRTSPSRCCRRRSLLPLPRQRSRPAGRRPSRGRRSRAGRAGRRRSRSSGRYLAGRVAEQDHDYETGADQLDLALAQAPGDLELVYAAFRLRIYAGRIDAAAQLAPQVLATRPGDGFANLVLAVQQIKKGDYRAAEQQLGRIGAREPARSAARLRAGLAEGRRRRISSPRARALAKLKPDKASAPRRRSW